MSDIANITLSKDLIEPIVKAQLQASITAALGRSDVLIAQTVQAVMNLQVDMNGKPSSREYGSRSQPLISWMAESAIKDAAKEAIKEWFASNKDEMKKQLRAAIQKNSKGMAESFVLNITKAVESSYGASVTVTLRPKD